MTRFGYKRHNRIAITADDGTSDIQTQRDWNDDHNEAGVLGFTGGIITLATDAITPTNSESMITVAAQTGVTDDFATLTATDYLTNDIVLLVADTGDTITVKHGTGNIVLLSGVDETLSLLIPLILRYDGTNWQQLIPTTAGLTNKTNIFTSSNTFADIVHTGRHQYDKGVDVASADAPTLGGDGNVFDITGTTTINHIQNTGWQIGSKITLHFVGAVLLNHATGGETGDEASLYLQNDVNYTTSAGDIIEFVLLESTQWQETSRNIDVDTGDLLPVVDTTSIVEGSADATKELRFEVDGNSTGVVGTLATTFTTAKTITFPDVTDTVAILGANTWSTSNQNIASTGKWQEAGVAVSPIGVQDFPISSTGMWASTTSPAGGLTQVETTSNKQDWQVWEFDTTTAESVQFTTPMPRNYNNGVITVTFTWTNAAGLTTETVDWGIKALAVSNDDPWDASWGTEITTTDTWIAQNDIHMVTSANVTIGGTPADADFVQWQITRKTGTDNLTGDARLVGVVIHMTLDGATAA